MTFTPDSSFISGNNSRNKIKKNNQLSQDSYNWPEQTVTADIKKPGINIDTVTWNSLANKLKCELINDGEKIKIKDETGKEIIIKKGVLLGSGGFGAVYKYIEDVKDNPREFAVKQIVFKHSGYEESTLRELASLYLLRGNDGVPYVYGMNKSKILLQNIQTDFDLGSSFADFTSENQEPDTISEVKEPQLLETEITQTQEIQDIETGLIIMSYENKDMYKFADDEIKKRMFERLPEDLINVNYLRSSEVQALPEDKRKIVIDTLSEVRKEITSEVFEKFYETAANVIDMLHKHIPPLVHLDIKPFNIAKTLLDFGLVTKIVLSKQFRNYSEFLTYIANEMYEDLVIKGTKDYIDVIKYISLEEPTEEWNNIDSKINRPENDVFSFAVAEFNSFCQINGIMGLPSFFRDSSQEKYDEAYYDFIFQQLKLITREDGSQLLPDEFFRAFYAGYTPQEIGMYRGMQVEQIRPDVKELHNSLKNCFIKMTSEDKENLKTEMRKIHNSETFEQKYAIHKSFFYGEYLYPDDLITYEQDIKEYNKEIIEKGRPFVFYHLVHYVWHEGMSPAKKDYMDQKLEITLQSFYPEEDKRLQAKTEVIRLFDKYLLKNI